MKHFDISTDEAENGLDNFTESISLRPADPQKADAFLGRKVGESR